MSVRARPIPTSWRRVLPAVVTGAALLVPGVASAAPPGGTDPPPSSSTTTATTTTTIPPTSTTTTTVPPTSTSAAPTSTTSTTSTTSMTAAPTSAAPTSTAPAPTVATPVTSPPPSCRVSHSVGLGTTGPAATCVEQALAAKGYTVTVNASLGPADITALDAFVARQGWTPDGRAGPAALGRLGIYAPPPPPPPPPPPAPPTCRVSQSVGLGTTGPAATCVEQALAAKGYTVTVNASLGAADITALDAFVARQGWTPDGRAGPAALGRLGIYAPPPPPAPTCRVSTTVRLGSTGTAAQCLEQHLRSRGFAVTVNANFDAADVTALRAYQRQQGLVVDGVAGPVTLGRLGIYGTATATPPATAAGVPANSGTGRRIVYSRAQQRIWAIDANGVVVKTHRISGRLREPYAGTYSVYSRSMYTFSTDNPDVKWRYMVRFAYGPGGGRIGFHEIPTKFGVPLQSVSQLGQPLSGGCVRQSTADALWVWNWAGIGTKVVVL